MGIWQRGPQKCEMKNKHLHHSLLYLYRLIFTTKERYVRWSTLMSLIFIVMVSLNMGLYNGNMLLSPCQDLNGHTKCNVIFKTVDRKLDVISANKSWHKEKNNVLQATLEQYFLNCVYEPKMGHMNVISRRSNISQCVLKQNNPEKSCPKTSFLEFL